MAKDRTKHKILPPSKFGLIQITRQRVRPEMNIKTKEANPNKEFEVEAPILLVDKINTELNRIVKNSRYKSGAIYIHAHPFVAAYINKGLFSLKNKWSFQYKRIIKVIPSDSYLYLQYNLTNNRSKILKLKGLDSLLSIVQMPKGIPVGSVAIGEDGAMNAGLYAASIIALTNKVIKKNLKNYRSKQSKAVKQKP